MKVKDLITQYGLDEKHFVWWLSQSSVPYKTSAFGGATIAEDQDIANIVSTYTAWLTTEQERFAEEQAAAQAAEQKKQAALARMLITSGFNFDGFTITKYSGYISGDDVVQIDRGRAGYFVDSTADVGASLMASLVHIRRNALQELKEAAYALGCNAVIGVDFDYLTLDPETVNAQGGTLYLPYVFGVTANGNAVIIEKN
jgi:uncharacterized protein YbjQ (UPF0145 family)